MLVLSDRLSLFPDPRPTPPPPFSTHPHTHTPIQQVAHVDVIMRRREGRLMKSGSAVVAFSDPETAERAVAEMNGFDLGGREINVRMYNDEN